MACVICGKHFSGYKPVGSVDIYSRRDLEHRVGTVGFGLDRKIGYRHITCPNSDAR